MNASDICVPAVTVGYRGMGVNTAARLMHERHVGCLIVVEERDDSVKDVLALLRRRGVRRAPVVDHAGMLVGIVTVDDLLRHVAAELDDLAAAISTELVAESVAGS